jgi:hypothetical protein
MNSALEKLSGPGKSLRSEPPDAKEFAGLKRSGHARLTDAAKTDNSLGSRFDLAYNAAQRSIGVPHRRFRGSRADLNRNAMPEF